MSSMTPAWQDAYQDAIDTEDDSARFLVLDEDYVSDLAKPLLVWVHPGDAIEDREAFRTTREYEKSREFQARMAREIEERAGTHQIVVLHRQSSDYAFFQEEQAQWDYRSAMDRLEDNDDTVYLYGDDLATAAQWLIDHMDTASRPEIFLTGAYSDPNNGCLTFIGKALCADGVERLEVSTWSPSEPGSVANAWRPPQSSEASQDVHEPAARRRPKYG